MANIMMTDVCNLKCPYCFANEFVNKDTNEITLENFQKALEFIKTEPVAKVGLIGGEPTLHSKFREILRILIEDRAVPLVVLFTNGVKMEEFADELAHPKFRILVNCNAPKDIGQAAFDKMCRNLDYMINERYMKERITLGINIYEDNFEYDYILDLLKKYDYDNVRMSIVVPNTSEKRNFDVKRYFLGVKPKFKEFLYAMLSNNILPHYDCNKMPSCLIEESEKQAIAALFKQKQEERREKKLPPIPINMYSSSEIYTDMAFCQPVIDIRQDLTAVRCFGLSDCTKVNITDFKSINDLRMYYINMIDSIATHAGVSDDCMTCYKRKTMRCTGGCLAFKLPQILKMQEQLEGQNIFLKSEN